MVFGFGKKKDVKPSTSPIQQQREIKLEEISTVLKEVEDPRISQIIQNSKQIRGEIESNQKIIYDLILHLESDDLKLDDVDKNLKTIGKRGKDAVVNTIKKETKTTLTNVHDYDDVVALNNEVSQMLKRIGDILGLHTRVMHVFARKYADKLKDEIAKLAQNRNSLQALINEHEGFKSNSSSILDTITRIKTMNLEKNHKIKRLNDLMMEKTDIESRISILENEITEMTSTSEYSKFLEIKKRIDSLKDEKHEITHKIDSQFSKISRPLNKYTYVSSFDKPMKKLMDILIEDPYSTLTVENKNPITEILQAVTKSVVAGNVSVKDSDRSAEMIEETIEKLDEFLKLKYDFIGRVTELEQELSIFDEKALRDKKEDLEKQKLNLRSLEITYEKTQREIDEIKIHRASSISELERNLSHVTNEKVTVAS